MRALSLLAAAAILFAAAVFPACVPGCCKAEAEASMRAQMPCCDDRPSMTEREVSATRTAVVAPFHAPAAIVQHTVAAPLQHAAAPRIADAQPEPQPSPPLFLLNAQFLI
jgi:hypothetical protein